MKMFTVNGTFYHELIEYIEDCDIGRVEIEAYPEDYRLEAWDTREEPIVKFDAEWITDRLDEERLSEDGCESEISRIAKILNDNIDFDKINSEIPTLYFENSRFSFTKKDFLEAIS